MIFIFGKVRGTTGIFTSTIFVSSAFLAGSSQHSTISSLKVLYMVAPIDEYSVQPLKEFGGKKLKPTTKEGLDIDHEDDKKKIEELKEEFESLTKLMKEVLEDKVEKVLVSSRIADSPCVLTTSEYGWSANMVRIMKAQAMRNCSITSYMVSKKAMEVNPKLSIMTELEKESDSR